MRRGFATATVLGFIAVIGLLSAGALHAALFGEQLATSRMLHQRAMALSELGIEAALARVTALETPDSLGFAWQPLASSSDTVRVTLRHVAAVALSPGNTAGRFMDHYFEVESTGHVARGVRVTLVQGVRRILPTAGHATAE